MKKAILVFSLLSSVLLFSGEISIKKGVSPVADSISTEKKMMNLSLKSIYLVQKLTRDYLYKSSGLDSLPLNAKIEENMEELNKVIETFKQSVCDDTLVQHRLKLIALAQSNLQTIVSEKYSLDNMQLLLDLGTVISEASVEIIEAVENGMEIYKKDSNVRMLRLSAL